MSAGSEVVGAPGLPPRLRPCPLEVACGLALGVDTEAPALVTDGCGPPGPALEAAALRALLRPPCLVSFSGGRDSSAVLATAAALARREGLPPPIPTTYRFAAAPGSHEDDWQEQVIRHVGVPHWERMDLTSELDTVGPVAQRVLSRHGVLWPFNAHFHVPVLERAAGGSLLTGIGGDELFGPQMWSSARRLLTGRHRERGIRLPALALALAPRQVRSWALARHRPQRWPWMQAAAEADVTRRLSDWRARSPIGWQGGVAWFWRSRWHTVLAASMQVLAADAGAEVIHPFLDPVVVGAIASHFGRPGPLDRSAAMGSLFGDILPHQVLVRRSKAHFDEAFIAEHTHQFAAQWMGTGIDEAVVDPGMLIEEWRQEHPDPRSLLLMQAAWHSAR